MLSLMVVYPNLDGLQILWRFFDLDSDPSARGKKFLIFITERQS
jgi:hypothetical protein